MPRQNGALDALKVVAISLSVVLVAAVGIVGYAVVDTWNSVQSNAVDITGDGIVPPAPASIGALEGGFDMLIVGTDNDADQGDAFGARDATLNDVNIWLHVAADHSTAVAVSLPRDLVIPHPECTDPATGESFSAMSAQPLNVAYSRGGLSCVVDTVESLTGAEIGYAGTVSFNGVIALTDAVGGVPVCLVEPINDPLADLDLPAGTSIVEGETALAFLRTRHGVGDGSDLARISVQQSYLSSLLRTVKSDATFSDPLTLYRIARVAADHMTLSTTLANLTTMASMALTLKDIDLEKVVFVQLPVVGDPDNPGKVIPDEAKTEELLALVLSDQPFTLAGPVGSGVVVTPTEEPAPPAEPEEPTEPVDPEAPATEEPPVVAAPPTLEVPGTNAAQETCATPFGG
ncbi:LCP family protein [Agromyces atrinae]|uniref:LCP family protein n=1 Tax=Agromyces atrinae TaxID=592376 RepID=UPI001F595633|nr:LCP family protein [Agromyces atrinae]MCI2957710.1 LCP family protein [Agromyces atrinae]